MNSIGYPSAIQNSLCKPSMSPSLFTASNPDLVMPKRKLGDIALARAKLSALPVPSHPLPATSRLR
jgi:hypothetical protein